MHPMDDPSRHANLFIAKVFFLTLYPHKKNRFCNLLESGLKNVPPSEIVDAVDRILRILISEKVANNEIQEVEKKEYKDTVDTLMKFYEAVDVMGIGFEVNHRPYLNTIAKRIMSVWNYLLHNPTILGEQCINSIPDEAVMSKGNEAFHRRDMDEAVSVYASVIEKHPLNARAHSNLAQAGFQCVPHLPSTNISSRIAMLCSPQSEKAHYRYISSMAFTDMFLAAADYSLLAMKIFSNNKACLQDFSKLYQDMQEICGVRWPYLKDVLESFRENCPTPFVTPVNHMSTAKLLSSSEIFERFEKSLLSAKRSDVEKGESKGSVPKGESQTASNIDHQAASYSVHQRGVVTDIMVKKIHDIQSNPLMAVHAEITNDISNTLDKMKKLDVEEIGFLATRFLDKIHKNKLVSESSTNSSSFIQRPTKQKPTTGERSEFKKPQERTKRRFSNHTDKAVEVLEHESVADESLTDVLIKISGLFLNKEYSAAAKELEKLPLIEGGVGLKYVKTVCNILSQDHRIVLELCNDLKSRLTTDKTHFPFLELEVVQCLLVICRFGEAEKLLNDTEKVLNEDFSKGMNKTLENDPLKDLLLEMHSMVEISIEGIIADLKRQAAYHQAPNAVCKYSECTAQLGPSIYIDDPECKGFIRVKCETDCIVDYHPSCWKHYKKIIGDRVNDKYILQNNCLTPDCENFVAVIEVYDAEGIIKTSIHSEIVLPTSCEPTTPQKPNSSRNKQRQDSVTSEGEREVGEASAKSCKTKSNSDHVAYKIDLDKDGLMEKKGEEREVEIDSAMFEPSDMVELVKRVKHDDIARSNHASGSKGRKKQRDKKYVDIDVNYAGDIHHRWSMKDDATDYSAYVPTTSSQDVPTTSLENFPTTSLQDVLTNSLENFPSTSSHSGESPHDSDTVKALTLLLDEQQKRVESNMFSSKDESVLEQLFELAYSVISHNNSRLVLSSVEELGQLIADQTLQTLVSRYGTLSNLLTTMSNVFMLDEGYVIINPDVCPNAKARVIQEDDKSHSGTITTSITEHNADREIMVAMQNESTQVTLTPDKQSQENDSEIHSKPKSSKTKDVIKGAKVKKQEEMKKGKLSRENGKIVAVSNKDATACESPSSESQVRRKPTHIMDAAKIVLEELARNLFTVRTSVNDLKSKREEAMPILFAKFEDVLIQRFGAVIDENKELRAEISIRNFQIILNYLTHMWREEEKITTEGNEIKHLKSLIKVQNENHHFLEEQLKDKDKQHKSVIEEYESRLEKTNTSWEEKLKECENNMSSCRDDHETKLKELELQHALAISQLNQKLKEEHAQEKNAESVLSMEKDVRYNSLHDKFEKLKGEAGVIAEELSFSETERKEVLSAYEVMQEDLASVRFECQTTKDNLSHIIKKYIDACYEQEIHNLDLVINKYTAMESTQLSSIIVGLESQKENAQASYQVLMNNLATSPIEELSTNSIFVMSKIPEHVVMTCNHDPGHTTMSNPSDYVTTFGSLEESSYHYQIDTSRDTDTPLSATSSKSGGKGRGRGARRRTTSPRPGAPSPHTTTTSDGLDQPLYVDTSLTPSAMAGRDESGDMPKPPAKIAKVMEVLKIKFPHLDDGYIGQFVIEIKRSYPNESFKNVSWKKIIDDTASLMVTNGVAERDLATPISPISCVICLSSEIVSNWVTLKCDHRFHDKCIDGWFRKDTNRTCPTCRQRTGDD